MTVSIKDLYKLKSKIEEQSIEPMELIDRLVISRGYYANYHKALELFEVTDLTLFEFKPYRKGSNKERYSAHQAVSESLIRTRNESLIKLGRNLKTYHDLRCKADYNLNLLISETDKNQAEGFFNDIRTQIKTYINNYQLTSKTEQQASDKSIVDVKVDANTTVRLPRKTPQETKDPDVKRPSLKILK